jgi:hypothetical protein
MKIRFILGLLFLTAAVCVNAQQPQSTPQKTDDLKSDNVVVQSYVRPDKKTRQKNYFKSMFSLSSLGRTVVSSGFNTWRNAPEEWGSHWDGFGRRVASGVGKNIVKQTTIFALDESFKLDSKFYRSQKRNFGSKVKNAVISPFVARTPEGKQVFGFPRIIGTYTAAIIAAETWYPKRFTYVDGLKSGTVSLGFNVAFNLLKELIKK